MYVTGGIGSTYNGEAFTFDYDLPNDTAYAESCASIGLIFFMQRMLEMDGDAVYGDVMERALYNTVLSGDGSGLSQGQRQLISIARAAVADPPVMILDEATSSIDAKTERYIQHGIDHLLKGRTSFIIAHRLSTIKSCDKIMYISDKGIAESGTHDELMAKKGLYYKLCMAQAI